MAAVEGVLDRSVDGHGSVINVVGPAGIGKSRIVAEMTALAATRGIPVFSTFCESHASEIPFHAVARLLRAAFEIDELADDEAARASCALEWLARSRRSAPPRGLARNPRADSVGARH